MTAAPPLGVGIIGMGFMGATHLRAYAAAQQAGLPCRVVAVADARPERRTGEVMAGGTAELQTGNAKANRLFDPAQVRAYETPDELLADSAVDAVSICTYTDTHAHLAVQALTAGKHVLVEKPIALTAARALPVVEAARARPALRCMPALCMRFWPGWSWLKERVDSGDLGPVRSATFQRLGTRPDWASTFYADPQRSGAALIDLHLHDVDFVRWCFGEPTSVVSSGSLDHVTTAYRFDDGPIHCVAQGGWDQAAGYPFAMRYLVNFADATADFDLARAEPLRLTRKGRIESVALPAGTGYEREVAHFVEAVTTPEVPLRVTPEDAHAVARLLDAERQSLTTGQPVALAQ